MARHVAIIMDGNGRWASARGLSRSQGHAAGAEAVRRVTRRAADLGIDSLTLYAFSRENWNRPKEEVSSLFELLVAFLSRELPELKRASIRLRMIGDPAALPFAARKALELAMAATAGGSGMILNLALNYSGRDEIVRACRKLLREGVSPEALDEAAFAARLDTAGQPDPDLIIRTSGEMRLSNFLLYQSAYSELVFTPVLWPDFTEADFDAALGEFAARDRRFGALGANPSRPV